LFLLFVIHLITYSDSFFLFLSLARLPPSLRKGNFFFFGCARPAVPSAVVNDLPFQSKSPLIPPISYCRFVFFVYCSLSSQQSPPLPSVFYLSSDSGISVSPFLFSFFRGASFDPCIFRLFVILQEWCSRLFLPPSPLALM